MYTMPGANVTASDYHRTETDIDKTWLPHDSAYLRNKEWRARNFDDNLRTHYALLLHEDDVLTPSGMLKVRGRGDIFCYTGVS